MKQLYIFFLIIGSFFLSCSPIKQQMLYQTNNLEIIKLNKRTFIHHSYIQTQTWGKVTCNGMIYIHNNEALVFDTPTEDSASVELINWIEKNQKSKIKAVVINHFHADCLGGLKTFSDKKITSFANYQTKVLALQSEDSLKAVPITTFENILVLSIGKRKVINQYFGEAHTKDNIVSYLTKEKILFGGCMLKALDASKGNLADANVKTWSATVNNVKIFFNNVRCVIPGHGDAGGKELLDYTIDLFKETK